MRIIHQQPDHRCDLSLAPIDMGFDPRLHGIICTIPHDARIVGYSADGKARMVEGTAREIAAELRAAGYRVKIEHRRQRDARLDLRLTPEEKEQLHELAEAAGQTVSEFVRSRLFG